jgi:protoporphyrinogen oxidase
MRTGGAICGDELHRETELIVGPKSSGRVCILGAGLAGLSAAYRLGRRGYEVVVLEAAPEVGGLASSYEIDGTPVERYYHFICRGDSDLVELVHELGIGDRLHWRSSRTSFLHDGVLYGFGSPIDLLHFSPVPLGQRLRFGLNVIRSRYRRTWQQLDGVSASSWLKQQIGERAYQVIWDPLLRIKFGDDHHSVSAAWIWHRIHRIARSRKTPWGKEKLGYLERGSSTVIDALIERLDAMPSVSHRRSSPVERIHLRDGRAVAVSVAGDEQPLECDAVVSTVALAMLPRIVPELDADYLRRVSSIEYLGVVCCLLVLRRPLTNSFWVNINDRRIPFNGVIEYTNLNPVPGLGGRSVAYVPHYLRTSHERFGYDDDRLRAEVVAGLELVNPDFDESWIERFLVSRSAHAQAICTVGFSELVPAHETPARGLYVTDSAQFYPEDRTISAAIRLGRRVAELIIEERR